MKNYPLIGCSGKSCIAKHQCEQHQAYKDSSYAETSGQWERRDDGLLECRLYKLDPTVEDLTPKEPEGAQMELF
jgi:hypothetical protein